MGAPVARGNLTLIDRNQRFDVNPVDCELRIDALVVAPADPAVGGDQLAQHNWRRYHLQVADGRHSLVAESKRGQARQENTFDTPGVQAVAVAYWHDRQGGRREPEGYFTVEFRQGPIATM